MITVTPSAVVTVVVVTVCVSPSASVSLVNTLPSTAVSAKVLLMSFSASVQFSSIATGIENSHPFASIILIT